jgi:hypothetical protein
LDIFVEIVKHQCYGEKCVPQYEHKFAYSKNSQQSTKKISYQTSHVMKYGLGEAHSRLELTSTNI